MEKSRKLRLKEVYNIEVEDGFDGKGKLSLSGYTKNGKRHDIEMDIDEFNVQFLGKALQTFIANDVEGFLLRQQRMRSGLGQQECKPDLTFTKP